MPTDDTYRKIAEIDTSLYNNASCHLLTRRTCSTRQTDPDPQTAGNVIALSTMVATLALADTGSLFQFAMKLLNLPANATFLLRRLHIRLR